MRRPWWQRVVDLLALLVVYVVVGNLITWTGPWVWSGLPVPFYRWPLAAALALLAAPPLARWLCAKLEDTSEEEVR